MRIRALAVLAVVGLLALTLSLLHGQGKPPSTLSPVVSSPMPLVPAGPELGTLTPLQRQSYLTAQRGADWLFRMHNVKGRFLAGFRPSLKQVMEGDFYLRQATAAAALARAARYLGEDRYAARATQAVLSLLEDTTVDKDACRTITIPGDDAFRAQCAGALLVAICELPSPQKDVLDAAEQLCRGLYRSSARPSVALLGVLLCHKRQPADWKRAFVLKNLPACTAAFEKDRSFDDAAVLARLVTEAYLVTKDKALADCAYSVADWACELHYAEIDPRRLMWFGGFRSWDKGRPSEQIPTADGALLVCALLDVCRVAEERGDVARHQRFRETAERGLQFLATLQYTEAGTQHFAPWYRTRIVGGTHHSPVDGDLRIDHTACAVMAYIGYADQAKP